MKSSDSNGEELDELDEYESKLETVRRALNGDIFA